MQRRLSYRPVHELNLPTENNHSDDHPSSSVTSVSAEDSTQKSSAPAPAPPTPHSPRRKFPSEEKTHHCPHQGCDKAFNRPARLVEHLRSHNNERPFRCTHPGCDKNFLRETHLNHHVKSAHTSFRDYACDWDSCDKKFLTATRLRRHQAVHEGQEKFRCTTYPPCNETFRKHATLQRHITAVHLHKKPFPCAQIDVTTSQPCTQAFDTAGRLRAHEGRVHGGLRFWCTACPSEQASQSNTRHLGFPTYALLQAHLRGVHPPTCTLCGQACTTQRELRRHIQVQHSAAPPAPLARKLHTCPVLACGRTFTKPHNLTVHTRTVHEGEKRFVCGVTPLRIPCAAASCGRAFKTKASLEAHVRSQHLQQKRGSNRAPRPLSTAEALTGAEHSRDQTSVQQLQPVPSASTDLDPFEGSIAADEGGLDDDEGDEDAYDGALFDTFFDVEAELERRAMGGGDFWIGGGADEEDWQGDGMDGVMGAIDPALRF